MREAENDLHFMLRAISLAERGRITAPPNPWVGCVIVQDGKILGEGFHHSAGGPHAEVNALKCAAVTAKNATAYVTLEPCSHHGRTPPCAEALIQAGIKRVVIGIQDPDPQVSGRGIEMLRKAGIQVVQGIAEDIVKRSLRPYLVQRMTGLPFCLGKAAVSIDGRIAAGDGSSQWISSAEARADAHLLRAESQAIMVASGTAKADLPTLTPRNVPISPKTPPLRVVIDPHGEIDFPCPLMDQSLAKTIIYTTERCPSASLRFWETQNVEARALKTQESIREILEHLGSLGIIQVMIEGGAGLLGRCVAQKALNQLTLYIGPVILGDTGIPLFRNLAIETIEKAPKMDLLGAKDLGGTMRLDYLL